MDTVKNKNILDIADTTATADTIATANIASNWEEKTVHVLLQPEEQMLEIPRKKIKTVARLLLHLGLKQSTALVARGNIPLTPDEHIYPSQTILVRKVMSSG